MNKNLLVNLLIAAVVIAAIIVAIFALGNIGKKEPEIQLAAGTPETKSVSVEGEKVGKLPKVLTLYQKGEGESDLAAFVSSELAKEARNVAFFRAINVTEDPQAAVYYGVTEHPTIVILRPNGSIFLKYEGYLDKAKLKSFAVKAAQ
ncbi:MAG: thioredoxin family protein [Candidatus Margulisiibacteriota bacterium]|jgi:hypothetical protein